MKKGHLNLKDSKGIYHVKVTEISFITVEGPYTETRTITGKKYETCKSLDEIEEELKEHDNFFRTHRSYLVNMDEIDCLKKQDGGVIVMKDGSVVRLAKLRRKEFKQAYDK